jgi:hypothetical protein
MRYRFYEDFPYVEEGDRLIRALALSEEWALSPELTTVSERCLSAKCEALSCYESQIPPLFGNAEEMRQRVRDYMLSAAAAPGATEGLGERCWRPYHVLKRERGKENFGCH